MNASNFGHCLYCKRPLLTSFVYLPAVRGTSYQLPAHVGCVELAFSGLTGSDLADATAKRDAILDGVERLFLGATFTAVTP
jgi:hypothetical protein